MTDAPARSPRNRKAQIHAPRLLLDIGNSRLKWAWQADAGLGDCGVIVHAGEPAVALPSLAPVQPAEVWISHVTGPANEAPLAAAVRERFGRAPHFARSAEQWRGLRNGYAEPARLGVDRWLVMVAAWSEHRVATCIVDAGTALTVDGFDEAGRHLGGIIAAGLLTQQRAVLGQTRFATREQGTTYHAGLGLDTEACVSQGAMLACLGAIDRALSATAAVRRIVTGGDASVLLPHLHGDWEHRPDLVLEGLRVLADDR
ncbi:type III pantothenate kinase [Sinimarinibacterium flocculans]|uniref:Type III pantothenate kinase n=1 Tax=Sinimarinibacterium flocculans TaxID=985250 RepID=A0A318E2N4_9GAMM|nr:type III pantothenate kinase [Sinimarinibacterium flocculans]PXV64215.1 type III pantothenate kinase [Sinimarinibacterium flocculans]